MKNRSPSAEATSAAAGDLFGSTNSSDVANVTIFEITDSGYVACYCRGTAIATEHGETPVEALAVGDVSR